MYAFDAPDVWLTGMGMDDVQLAPEANRWAGWIAIAEHRLRPSWAVTEAHLATRARSGRTRA